MEDMNQSLDQFPTIDAAEDLTTEAQDTESQGHFFDRLRNKKTAILASSLAIAASGLLGKTNRSEAADQYSINDAVLTNSFNGGLATTPEMSVPVDKKLYDECVSYSIHGTIAGAGYKVLPGRKNIEWSLAVEPNNAQCLKYGTRIVQLYAASFKRGSFPLNPQRLGKTVSFVNPSSSKLLLKRQTLTRAAPRSGELSDVETMIWQPKPGLGERKSYTRVGIGSVEDPAQR
jgi:hypothetical protein